jgi:hypothetical protein
LSLDEPSLVVATVLPSPFAVAGAVVITLSALVFDTSPSSLVAVVLTLSSSVVVVMTETPLLRERERERERMRRYR